jgi:transposase-like protein
MSILSQPQFHDEQAAFDYVEAALWPNGPVCPHCGGFERISAIKPNPEKRVRLGLKFCGQCRKQFTVRVGTIFEESKLPLHKWLQAIFLMCSSKKGVSSHQLMRTLETTYKTAWFLSHRIRLAMAPANGGGSIGGEGMTIEVDETFIGKRATKFDNEKGWVTKRGTADMQVIMTLVERGGRARSIHVANLRKDEVARVMKIADRRSILNTDQAAHYRYFGEEFVAHESVNHGKDEYVRGDAHTNTVEGFYSIFKRGMKGVYQHCGDKHLHRYLAEFDFRYSNRIALGVDDQERAGIALQGVAGKRLTYRRTDERPQVQAARQSPQRPMAD